MNKFSFEGIGQEVVTFMADENAENGCPVKVSENMKVSPCADGNVFAGIAISGDDGAKAVVIRGYVTAAYTGTAPALGYVTLAANGAGGVKAASGGRPVIVCEVDTANSKVGMFIL